MKLPSAKKAIAFMLVFCTLFMVTGCSIGKQKTLADPYELQLNLNIGGSTAAGFSNNLVVVENEEQYSDDVIRATSALIFDVTNNKVLFSKDAFKEMYPASITKLLTVLLVLENCNLEDTVTITSDMLAGTKDTSLCGVREGDILTVEQLLYGTLLPSGNDAANALAYHMSGSIEAFAEKMNERAKELGATGSHFVNPSGLTDTEHVSTAYDIYLIFKELLDNELFLQIIGTDVYTANYTNAQGEAVSKDFRTTIFYTNGKVTPPENVLVLGGKTGTTPKAMYCLAMLSKDQAGNEYISVVLQADSREQMYHQMNRLMEKIYN